jgi:hypothetical protein
MELSRWLLVVLLEAHNGNFLCLQVVAIIKALCSCYSSIARALVFVTLLLHTHLFLLDSYCAYVLVMLMLQTCYCCSSSLDPLTLVHWVVLQLLTLLRYYVILFLSSWPSCVDALRCFSVLDLLALCVTLELLTLLHCSSTFDPFTLFFSY